MDPDAYLSECKTHKRRARFLLSIFPPGLERNAPHLQITDNYITNTRLRLRKIRVPESRDVSYLLTRISHPEPENPGLVETVNTILSPAEYGVLSIFEGNELRKNRYEYVLEDRLFLIDFYLGPLWGLFIATTDVETEKAHRLSIPAFAIREITQEKIFSAPRLTSITLAEIRNQFNLS